MNLNSVYNKLEKLKNTSDFSVLDEIMKEIETEIITNGKTDKGITNAWKRFLKDTKIRPTFNQVYMSQADNYVVCNGYYLIDYGTDKNNVPKELQAYINTKEYEKPTIDFEHIKLNEAEEIKKYEINVADVEKLHKWNKLNKKQIPFRVQNKYINGDYLLDILSLMGLRKNNKITVRMTDSNIAPMEILTDNIKSILLPIRIDSATSGKEYTDKILNELGI